MDAITKTAQLRLTRHSPAYWRVTIDNPPINVMGPQMVAEFQGIIERIETDDQVKVVVFDSAVDGYFLNHSDFTAPLEDLTGMSAADLMAERRVRAGRGRRGGRARGRRPTAGSPRPRSRRRR